MSQISITFDIEPDIHTGDYKGVTLGISEVTSILDKQDVKATFFATCDCIEKYPKIFQHLKKQGHEIALHGYRHIRFDELSLSEKKEQIEKSVKIFKRILNENPRGFRAPQHSIDNFTLKILKQNNLSYDSSCTPFNFLQLLFFPKKFKLGIKGFFSSRRKYQILKDFYELPVSSFLIPFVSLPLRIFPWKILKIYLWFLKMANANLVFYAHSWDFIELPKSKIDRMFSHGKLIKNMGKMIDYFSRKSKFVKMEELI